MITPPKDEEQQYYTDTKVIRLLGISLEQLHNKLMTGDPLPPRLQPPGCQRLWPRAACHEWLAQFLVHSGKSVVSEERGSPHSPSIQTRYPARYPPCSAESLRQANRRHLDMLQQDIARLNITDSPLTQKLYALQERVQRKRAKKAGEP